MRKKDKKGQKPVTFLNSRGLIFDPLAYFSFFGGNKTRHWNSTQTLHNENTKLYNRLTSGQ